MRAPVIAALLSASGAVCVVHAQSRTTSRVVEPDSAHFITVTNGHAERTTYRGRRAVKLVPSSQTAGKDLDMLAVLDDGVFKDGIIDVDVAGAPRAGMPPDSRGFVGIAFRTGDHGEWSEVFYLRPTNGRADDQLRRNHSVQYISHPDFTWSRLRSESPGVYESYVDLEPGAWTHMRIDVSGASARLYVNGASQPCLIVNDLKRGSEGGRIAFWAHVETDAYFGALSVAPIDGRSSPSPLGARGAFFALSVRDLAASRDWYASTFGMHVALATPGTASTPAFALLEGDHLLVELIQSGPSAPQSNRPPGTVPGLFKAGMLVDDLDSAVAVLRARHVEIAFGPFPARSDQRSNVIVRDPSGNLIQLIGR